MNSIKLFVMDVDGTMTDGKIYIGRNEELMKAFSVKDGCGISMLLPNNNIIPVVITARESSILEERCGELGIKEVYQNAKDKLVTLKKIIDKYNIGFESVAYVGDDLPDIPCMEVVKREKGMVLCPCDAIPEIRELADFISSKRAGEGAIRDCIDYLCKHRDKSVIDDRISYILQIIPHTIEEAKSIASLPEWCSYILQDYTTKDAQDCIIESHRKHVDVQVMLLGYEEIRLMNTSIDSISYDEKKDVEYWREDRIIARNFLTSGSFSVIRENQLHQGGIMFKNKTQVVKGVFKINCD